MGWEENYIFLHSDGEFYAIKKEDWKSGENSYDKRISLRPFIRSLLAEETKRVRLDLIKEIIGMCQKDRLANSPCISKDELEALKSSLEEK